MIHGFVIVDVDRDRDFVDDLESVGESKLEGLDDDDGVDVSLKLGQSLRQDFTSWREAMSVFSSPKLSPLGGAK